MQTRKGQQISDETLMAAFHSGELAALSNASPLSNPYLGDPVMSHIWNHAFFGLPIETLLAPDAAAERPETLTLALGDRKIVFDIRKGTATRVP